MLLVASTTTKAKSGSSSYFLIVVVIAVLGFMLVTRRRSAARLTAAQPTYTVGDEIITGSGIIATIISIDDDEAVLEISPGVHLRVIPAAIARVRQAADTIETATDDGPLEDRPDWPTRSENAADDDHDALSTGPDDAPHPAAGSTDDVDAAAGSTAAVEDAPGEEPPQAL